VSHLTSLAELYNGRLYDGDSNRLRWSETIRSAGCKQLMDTGGRRFQIACAGSRRISALTPKSSEWATQVNRFV
jgi:hypothetical protein